MANRSKDSTRYQLSRFLQSDTGINLAIDAVDIAILMTLFDFMDIDEDEQVCFASQLTISKICHVPRRTLQRRLEKLKKLELIEIVRGHKKETNYYYRGKLIKNFNISEAPSRTRPCAI